MSTVSNHFLFWSLCILNTSDQLRSVLPELWGFLRSSGLLRVRLPLDPQFVFIRSLGEIDEPLRCGGSPRCSMWRCSIRCSQFDYWIPLTLTDIIKSFGGNKLQWGQGLCVAPLPWLKSFFKALFHHRNSLLAPVSTRNGRLIAPCSQLHSTRTELVRCGQIRSQF